MIQMKRLCAWCGESLEDLNGPAKDQRPITHGICPACAEALWRESEGVPLRDYLASLNVPIFLADGDGRVQGASPVALEMLDKTHEEVHRHLGGEVFDCVNSALPGGCGHTDFCSACTVRNTVMASYESGESHNRVPAALTIRRNGEVQEMSFLLTTERLGNGVLIRVDPDPAGDDEPEAESG